MKIQSNVTVSHRVQALHTTLIHNRHQLKIYSKCIQNWESTTLKSMWCDFLSFFSFSALCFCVCRVLSDVVRMSFSFIPEFVSRPDRNDIIFFTDILYNFFFSFFFSSIISFVGLPGRLMKRGKKYQISNEYGFTDLQGIIVYTNSTSWILQSDRCGCKLWWYSWSILGNIDHQFRWTVLLRVFASVFNVSRKTLRAPRDISTTNDDCEYTNDEKRFDASCPKCINCTEQIIDEKAKKSQSTEQERIAKKVDKTSVWRRE